MRLLLVAALLIGTGLSAATTAVAAPSAGCADTIVFQADGYRSGQSMSNWNGSAFNASPPAGWEIVPIRYDAFVFPALDPQPLDESVAEGVGLMREAVVGKHRACPGSRLVLAGFSEGAVVAGDVLEGFADSGEIPHGQLQGVLYGNPRRPFGEGGTGGRAGGIETNLPTVAPGVTMRGGQDYGDLAVRNVCNENDGICNSANLVTNLAAFANGLAGYLDGDHGYTLDPAADLGSGLLFHRQPPRLPYGPPLSPAVATPWEIQRSFGGTGGQERVAAARPALAAMLGRDATEQLTATSPWYRIVTAAHP